MTTMPAPDNATLVRNAIERGEPSMFAPSYVFHGPPELLEADCPSARTGAEIHDEGPFSNEQIRLEQVSANGDRVVVRFEGVGRHSSSYRGVAPSGRQRAANVVAVYRIEDGRLAEGWGTLSWD
jgi:hypothetical protein